MSLAQPSESTTIYACPQCGVDGVFGYLNKDGDLIWYCVRQGRCGPATMCSARCRC